MSTFVPNRSARGCLTCKRRRKKCGEERPTCNRCQEIGYECLGYDHLNKPSRAYASRNRSRTTTQTAETPRLTPGSSVEELPNTISDLRFPYDSSSPPEQGIAAWTGVVRQATSIPRSIQLDAIDPQNLSPFVVAQMGRLASRLMFGPVPYDIRDSLARLSTESPEIKRWSLYLGARIIQAVLEGSQCQQYIGWIDRFQQRATDTSVSQVLDIPSLEGRLSCLEDLGSCALMISDTRTCNSIYKQSLPIFLQLAAKLPDIWSENSAISICRTLRCKLFEMRKFVLRDTVVAIAFGTAPLLHYDTAFYPATGEVTADRILEWVFGCPNYIIVLLAQVNAWRVSRWIDGPNSNPDEWQGIEEKMKSWSPTIDRDQSENVVARFAIQESWRQAVLIYTYMGICSVDSSDSRVEASVQQIVQMAGTIEAGNAFEIHLVLPCLIAGIAARQEHHRSLLRSKLNMSRNENIWCLRGADFVPVLDHLWHGAGAGGRAVTWEDYVMSRCVVLPIEG